MRESKQVIFDHMPDTCYRTLKNKYTRYVYVTYLEIYDHLVEEYGELLDGEMQENEALMKSDITDETQFGDLVQKIEDCVENVVSQNPYTPAQTVSIGFNIIYKCEFYSDDCQDCKRKANLDKTWPDFKVHFAGSFKKISDSNKTTGNSGFANLVIKIQNYMQTIANENVQTVANYANKSAIDMNAIETLKEKLR